MLFQTKSRGGLRTVGNVLTRSTRLIGNGGVFALSGVASALWQELFTDATNDTGFSNTRATTQYVETDTGALYPVPAGAIPIQKARPARNLAASSDTPSTQNITVVVGRIYAVRIGSESASGATAVCSGAFTGTLTGDGADSYALNGSATTTTLTVTITGSIRKLQVQDITHRAFNNLGADVVINGGFDTDSNWSKTGNVTIGSGTANYDGTTLAQCYQAYDFTDGDFWLVQVTLSGSTTGSIQPRISASSGISNFTGNGRHFAVIRSTGYDYINFWTQNGFDGSIDNVTVRPLSDADLVPDEYVSTGVGTGEEEVTNGTFDINVDDWDGITGWTGGAWASGQIAVTVSTYKGAAQAISTVIGATYEISGNAVSADVAAVAPRLYVGSAANPSSSTLINKISPGSTFSYSFVATATSHAVGLSSSSGSGVTTWDNISVKRCDPGLTGIDGFRYFTTALANTVDGSGVVTEGTGAALTGITLANRPGATNLETLSAGTVATNNATAAADGPSIVAGQDRIKITATSTFAILYSTPTLTDSTDCCVWRYLEAGTTDWAYIQTRTKAGTVSRTCFDLGSGAIGTVNHASAGMREVSTGVYLCWIVFNAATGGTAPLVACGPAIGDGNFATSTETIYSHHRQTEAGTLPTAPIVTSGSTASTDAAVLDFSGVTGFVTPNETRIVCTGLGPDIVTGGDFSNPADWTTGTGVNISNGAVEFTGTAVTGCNQAYNFTAGDSYLVIFSIVEYTSGNLRPYIGANNTSTISGVGLKVLVIPSNGYDYINLYTNGSFIGKIDNLKVYKIDPTRDVETIIDIDNWDGTDLSDILPHANVISVTQYAPGERP